MLSLLTVKGVGEVLEMTQKTLPPGERHLEPEYRPDFTCPRLHLLGLSQQFH